MIRWAVFIYCILLSFRVKTQPDQRLWISMSPTLTFGNQFESGGNRAQSPDNQTGINVIYPLYSVLDGAPDIRYSGLQILARKFSWALHWEYPICKQWNALTGIEIGARGYKLESERSVSSLNSYRNWAVPVLINHENILNEYWALNWRIGFMLNYAFSQHRNDRVFIIQPNPTFYPLFGGGIELAYKSAQNRLAFELATYLGQKNVINHQYVGFDNRAGERIFSSGSHLRASIRYKIKEKPANYLLLNKKQGPPFSTQIIDQKIIAPKSIAPDLGQRTLKLASPPLTISTDSAIICVRDDQTIDGDSLWIIWNAQQPISIALISSQTCVSFSLHQNQNTLSIHAINEGKIPPNTFEISVYDQHKDLKTSLKLKCSLKQSLWLQLNTPQQ